MEEFYRLDTLVQCSDEMVRVESITGAASTADADDDNDFQGSLNDLVRSGSGRFMESGEGSEMSDLIKTQIATHPLYPQLVSAYIECQKVGAPPEIATLLEEIGRDQKRRTGACAEYGADPELDEFMESYCEMLQQLFVQGIASQMKWAGVQKRSSVAGEVEAPEGQEYLLGMPPCDKNLKEVLLRKYSGYLSSLRKEFLKKRKNGKLPKDARMTLLNWWNSHYRWPYPTEEEKLKLSEVTGLDQKQINNWFINQRKRHWKPSEDMRFALMEGVSSGIGTAAYFDTGGGGQNDV
ncbi:hypothetical protein NL676_020059 [Syzygium grande]|nr:hypothetical protein NL676_020059 [Syzygium grande]